MAVRFLPLICFLLAILAVESEPGAFRSNTGDYIRKGKRIGNVFDEQFTNTFPPVPGAAASMEGAFHTRKIIRQLQIGDDIPVGGEPECPCLSYEELDELTTEEVEKGRQELGNETDLRTYGIGCNFHDLGKAYCSEPCSGSYPSADCDLAWCKYAWCWVSDDSCKLARDKSTLFASKGRQWSYATCHSPDVYKHDFTKLYNMTLRIGLNHHAGGWLGAFSKSGKNFEGPLNQWTGPSVSFIKEAAAIGQLNLEIKTPEDFLVNRSAGFMKTNSKFDLCIYATALGFLDMCVASYVITEERAGVTDWVVLGAQDLYLVTKSSAKLSEWTKIMTNMATIFQPFEWKVWVLAVVFVIPCMGILMVFHERGKPGGSFPTEETVLESSDDHSEQVLKERKVPLWEHLCKGIYVSFLSVLQLGYSQSVISLGAHLNLIGISFFILTFLAVYTANLAAILTKQQKRVPVASLYDATVAGLRLCAARKDMEIISNLHNIDVTNFIPDPIALGGDGKPGFQCANCAPRARVFDVLDQELADLYPDDYCHAAIAQIDDLTAAKAAGFHCNKTEVGSVLGQVYSGLPVFEMKAKWISALLLNIKNKGVYDLILMDSKPVSLCQDEIVTVVGGETSSLGIDQLTGIWVVSSAFAILGLCATFVKPRLDKRRKKKTIQVTGYDQTGQRINMLERGYSWIANRGLVDEESGRVFVKDPFNLELSRHSDAVSGSNSGRECPRLSGHEAKKSSDLDKKSEHSSSDTKRFDTSRIKFVSYSFNSEDESSRSSDEQNGTGRTGKTDAVADENPESANFDVKLLTNKRCKTLDANKGESFSYSFDSDKSLSSGSGKSKLFNKGWTTTSETTDPIKDRDENIESSGSFLSSSEQCNITISGDINDAPVLALNVSLEKCSSWSSRKKNRSLMKRNSQRRSKAGNDKPFSAGPTDGSSLRSDDSSSMASDDTAPSAVNGAPPKEASNESPSSRQKTL